MPRILHINATANWGSTGRIAEQLCDIVKASGWDCFIAYGRHANVSNHNLIKVGNRGSVYVHYIANRVLDNEGLSSCLATKRLVRKIKQISPDIIHLHNLHDHWINYKILFEYLNSTEIPVVWTQHDCWAFTGGCAHYALNSCMKWQSNCDQCSYKRSIYDAAARNFLLKKKLFLANKNLTIVPVSCWLRDEISKSFLKKNNIQTIYNGVDTNIFKYKDGVFVRKKYGLRDKFVILGVASAWSDKKGFKDYISLSKILPDDCVIVMVGLPAKQIASLPKNIIGIERTNNVEELVELYSMADVVLNLSYQESFGLTTVEGMACGTPSIVYNVTASPELVTKETGVVVSKGDIEGVLSAVHEIKAQGKEHYFTACCQRATSLFDKDKCYDDYMKLYQSLLSN